MMSEKEFESLKGKISESMSFPGVYMYKFIVETNNRNIALVENLFEEDAEILTRESGRGRYTSITAKQVVMNVEEIISKYRSASRIKGIMFL